MRESKTNKAIYNLTKEAFAMESLQARFHIIDCHELRYNSRNDSKGAVAVFLTRCLPPNKCP
ncbi:hypothetical protein [Helicobacter rodentium]|uniref:hypothetical protein n=1 Tax=Helicobacter rodentium TaxID=59617 RepID=UPI000A8C2F13|nr:hypothetical protein [Helicobacter rodentium]